MANERQVKASEIGGEEKPGGKLHAALTALYDAHRACDELEEKLVGEFAEVPEGEPVAVSGIVGQAERAEELAGGLAARMRALSGKL